MSDPTAVDETTAAASEMRKAIQAYRSQVNRLTRWIAALQTQASEAGLPPMEAPE